ncbi:MAG TPA: NADH-quinone oxidoreductase subunit M [Anaerolineales bacterium]|nr:NADH-quinone oxidoreductase subunit M [Anaerolineales bacterium]
MQFPVISIIVFAPLVAAIIMLLMKEEAKNEIRVVALTTAVFDLILSAWVYLQVYMNPTMDYQFVEKVDWLPKLGISYHVGVDGISTPLVLLTGIVMFTGVLISWGIDDRPREFFAFMFLLAGGVFGVFVSLDLFLLFFFYEIAVFPMYLLIAIWGWKVTREYAAMKLTLYLFLGSVFALVGALAMYFTNYEMNGVLTFDMLELEKAGFSTQFQYIWFLPVFLGFAILGGIFPFHNWSPDGHVAAPTAVSMFHAGVLMKLGAFAALRVGIMLLPEGAKQWAWLIFGFAMVNVVYGAFIAFIQKDMKYVIGFSSVSHMGLVALGFSTLTADGITGASLQMFSHGVMTALFFAATGMVYDRAHTRQIPELGGMVKYLPWVAISFIVGALVSMGMPGFSGFVAEFPIFMGVWQVSPIAAIIASISIVITAAYILLVVRKVFFGEIPEHLEGHITPVSALDKVALATLVIFMVALGTMPFLMVPMVQEGVNNVLRILGGA